MTNQEKQKELRKRLVPEIKFSWFEQSCFLATAGHIGKIYGITCNRGVALAQTVKQDQRHEVTEQIMRQVFEKEGCL